MWLSKSLRRSIFTLTRDAIVVDAEQVVLLGRRLLPRRVTDLADRVAAVELQVAPLVTGSRRPPIVKVGDAR